LSQYTDGAETPEEIIQVLCDRCRTRPLIMAIHGVQDINPLTLQTLLSGFWGKLIQKLNEQAWCRDRCDCILFLTTDLGTQHSISDSYGINLLPWDIVTVEHMQQWLKPVEVKQFLAECSGESAEDACLDLLPKGKQSPDNLGPPEEILTKICTTFELNSLTELETYWKIAS
jgi:inactive STAND